MTDLDRDTVLAVLARVTDPVSGKDVVSAGMIDGVVVRDGHIMVSLSIDPARGPEMEPLRRDAEKAVEAIPGVLSAAVVLTAQRQTGGRTTPRPAQASPPGGMQSRKLAVPGVRHIIAVASGKGGVGKSTTAVNLALALAAAGQRVGILDADIYGPSLPRMLGLTGKPSSPDGKTLDPKERYGVKAMSIGFLIDEDTPMIWRGPMVQSAINQMLRDVNWGELDVLVVDMPPGTGDAQLTMAQQVPLSGAVIVSTPQDIALIDARKGLNMFRKVDVPVLGMVENMSSFVCPSCGSRHDIFGHGGAKAEAERLGCAFLGEIPLDLEIRETSDAGTPVVAVRPDGPHAKAYRAIAAAVLAELEGGDQRPAPRIVFG